MTLLDKLHNDSQPSSVAAEVEVIQPAVQDKNVRRTTFILVGAVVLVVGGLFFFNKKSLPAKASAAASAQQMQIETAIAQLTGIKTEGLSQVDQLVNKFNEFADFQQVLPSQLKQGPFSPAVSANLTGERAPESAFGKKTDSMQLLSIMQSKYGNCCMINDMLLYEGDEIDGFTVAQIGDDFVKLIAEGKIVILRLEIE